MITENTQNNGGDAAGQSQAPGQQPASIAPANDPTAQTDNESLDATITYLEGLPTGTDINSAIENVQAWQQKLRAADQPELNQIADELGSLIQYLSAPEPDGKAIGRLLIQIGEHTMASANAASAGTGTKVKSLGNWLKEVGEDL